MSPLVLLFLYTGYGTLVLIWCPVNFVDVDFFIADPTVTPETEAKGLLSAIESNHQVYIRYILCFATIAAILRMRSINLVVGAWQKGQITWISDLWLVVGHAIMVAPTSLV